VQEAVHWKTQTDGKKQGWGHVQFRSEADMKAAVALSGQSFMGRSIEIHLASESEQHKLNLGAPVKDCWFCLSNEEVRPAITHFLRVWSESFAATHNSLTYQ
jgi:hypothetical protein